MKKFLLLIIIFCFAGCGDDNPSGPEKPGSALITVKSLIDNTNILSANVILFNADNGESVARAFTGVDGTASFNGLNPGNYYLRISAQGFTESPQGNVSPVPFSVLSGQTYSNNYYLDTVSGSFGMIAGTVNPKIKDVLIAADPQTGTSSPHTYTGPDGYFVLYNLEYNTYSVRGVKSGYISITEPEVVVSSTNPSSTVEVGIAAVTGSTLSGKVTFLAVNNGIVDVSLLDHSSLSVINGLTTVIDSSRNFTISNIPTGVYKAWASYKNDGYVMDPDWIFKNPGALDAAFGDDTARVLNFSVTGAIQINSPTNPPHTILPAAADSIVPMFSWSAYPQAKEYIIEVTDINGRLIWGGFDASGLIRHAPVSKDNNSIRFNFDGSASMDLIPGEIYQWKIYADNDAAPNVQTLLSRSEDLMGLFKAP